MELVEAYKKNRGKKPLFSEWIVVDWYDGITSGACKLNESDQWFLCNLCYFYPEKDERILSLIEVDQNDIQKLQRIVKESREHDVNAYYQLKKHLKETFTNFRRKAYLGKNIHFENLQYEVVLIPACEVRYFDTLEDVLHDKTGQSHWKNFFSVE